MGLRPGQLLGLPWRTWLDEGRLRVSQSLKREYNGLVVGEAQNVAVTANARHAGARHRCAQEASRPATERADRRLRHLGRDRPGLHADGRDADPSNLHREFDKLTRKAGIGRWHPHELRHSGASLLSAAGVPIEQIADVLGHEGSRTTAAVYRHLINPSVTAGKAPMDAMFSEPTDTPT